MSRAGICVALVLAAPGLSAQTTEPEDESLVSALEGGRLWLDLRYRFEYATDDARPDDSYASTMRTVLGYETARWKGFAGLVEFEDVSVLGPDDFNDTRNGMTDRVPVPDPPGTSVNRAYLSWAGPDETEARLGRQYIVLDNQRWVGNFPWRQRHATFEAAGITTGVLGGLDVYYGYVDRFNTPIRTSLDSRSHLLNVSHDVPGWGRISGYGYYVDLPEFGRLSCFTSGLRFVGERRLADELGLLYEVEVAHQVDAADNTDDRDATYFLFDVGARHRGARYTLGLEVLGGDGTPGGAIQAPFGRKVYFNGWANVFALTPDTGLRDVSAKVVLPLRELELEVQAHDFRADSGGARYGTELDAALRWRPRDDLAVELRVAAYQADEFLEDVTRAWLMTRFSF